MRTNTIDQLWWKDRKVTPEEFVKEMRQHAPGDLHKQWWNPKVWALLTKEEKGSMADRVTY
jgi:hypothetical protein